ncbi:MAG: 3-hydroxyacyl-CoA dehydrogenase family protein, partial [Solirubrobacterales bacterium]
MSEDSYERPAIAGSGAIACGLAACASVAGRVHLLARSDAAAWRAEEKAQATAAKIEDGDPRRVRVTTNVDDLVASDLVVEAIVEELETKTGYLAELGTACADADLASTTSSLSISELGERSGHAERLFGLHVFNPVPRMELIELCLPERLRPGAAERARTWCGRIGKTAIEVADQAGFVVNRLLFPYLFDAVRLMEETAMSAEDVDSCMTLGAAYPMGPLKLLDFVGLDVAVAIGEGLHRDSGEARH